MNNPKGLNDYIENNELHVVALVTADQVLESFSPSGSEYDSVDDIWGAKRFHVAMRLDVDEEKALVDAGFAVDFTYPVKDAVDGQNTNDNNVLVRLDEALRNAAPIESDEDLSRVLAEMERQLKHEARLAMVIELAPNGVSHVISTAPADIRVIHRGDNGMFGIQTNVTSTVQDDEVDVRDVIDKLDASIEAERADNESDPEPKG